MSTQPSGVDQSVDDVDREIVPEILEWLVAALIAIVGLAMAMGGSALLWASDEALIARAIADAVADGSLEIEGLTQAQLTEVAASTAFWLGVGLILTGLALVVVAVVYVIGRYRTRRSTGSANARERLFADSVIGAVATGLLSFVPASPILGGAVAGYLHSRRGGGATKAGAVSGVLSAAPFVVILLFLTAGLFTGFADAGVGLGVVVALAMGIAIVATLVYSVGLAAIGGFLADFLASDEDRTEVAAEPADEESTAR